VSLDCGHTENTMDTLLSDTFCLTSLLNLYINQDPGLNSLLETLTLKLLSVEEFVVRLDYKRRD